MELPSPTAEQFVSRACGVYVQNCEVSAGTAAAISNKLKELEFFLELSNVRYVSSFVVSILLSLLHRSYFLHSNGVCAVQYRITASCTGTKICRSCVTECRTFPSAK
jgi:hypothetical protein